MDENEQVHGPSHRLTLVLTPDGRRFFQCTVCNLSIELPKGQNYYVIAQQFDARACIRKEEESENDKGTAANAG